MRAHEAGALHAEGYGGPPHWLPWPTDVMELLPQLWPQTVDRDEQGRLTVGGLDVVSIAREFGTAAYVIDEVDFRARARAFRDEFAAPFAELGGVDVFYAGKAFLCTEVARWVADEGLCLDVCSGGELAVAQRAGFPPERIGLHGNNKSVAEIRQALEYGVGRIVVDSFEEIDRIAAVATELGVRAPVMVRVTVGVEAHTHEFIATAHEDQKFGFSLAGG
jgi:diaminopimelate decarboxylase